MSSLTALVPVLCRVWLTIRSAANAHSFEFLFLDTAAITTAAALR